MRPGKGLMSWDNSELSRDGERRGNNETEEQASLEVRRWETSHDRSLWLEFIIASIQVIVEELKDEYDNTLKIWGGLILTKVCYCCSCVFVCPIKTNFLMRRMSVDIQYTKLLFGGTSLVVQWLSLCTPNAGDVGKIPGQRTRSHSPKLRVHMLQLKTQQLRPGAAT